MARPVRTQMVLLRVKRSCAACCATKTLIGSAVGRRAKSAAIDFAIHPDGDCCCLWGNGITARLGSVDSALA